MSPALYGNGVAECAAGITALNFGLLVVGLLMLAYEVE